MNHWKAYLKERLGREIIESEEGFAVYTIVDKICHLEDIYIRPESRRTHVASTLADKVVEAGREHGCKYLRSEVWLRAHGSTVSLKAALGYGFNVIQATDDRIIMVKEIGG